MILHPGLRGGAAQGRKGHAARQRALRLAGMVPNAVLTQRCPATHNIPFMAE